MATLNQTIRDAGATSNVLTAENGVFYSKTLLKRLMPQLVFSKYATKPSGSTIPKRAGDTVSFRTIAPLAVAKTPIVEGVLPEGVGLVVTPITATVLQYGNFIKITDRLDLMAIDPIVTETVELLGENAGQTTESIVGDVIFAGSTIYRAAGVATRLLVNTTVSYADLIACRSMLKKANVKPLANGHYVALVPVKVANDIMGLAEWKAANTYNHDGQVSGSIGTLAGIEFVELSEDFITKYTGLAAGGLDAYASLVMGKDYFGIVDIEGSAKPEIIIKEPTDALNLVSSVGWKNLFVAKRLNESCAVRLETL